MRGNWYLLIVAAAALISLITLCLGVRLERWEPITSSAVLIVISLLGYAYSREV